MHGWTLRHRKEMSTETQFIVIIHAKRTMEAAQGLNGLTMQEPGLSSPVSVRFDPVPQGSAPSATAGLASA
jgi:chromosome segregation ATPase